ncbi:MAG: hypothetical protein LBR61_04900, partial [Synergistaceae bacterium]|nr:hypothetical protein [Synergistaceae bacterium]
SPTAPRVLCGVHTGEQVTAGKLNETTAGQREFFFVPLLFYFWHIYFDTEVVSSILYFFS